MIKKLDLNSLDKSNWNSFTFEQIAEKKSKTVQPSDADVDVYVGLEHIDGNDIHIRRRGIPSDVNGGKLRCSPGNVIFGKRRAYQRKAAIVDFDGICSAHAFVFQAIPGVIDPKLFPFFLHSDQFMHRMIDISVGGLSPTINWGDLKDQEFLLPPRVQQTEIAELLWSMDVMVQKDRALLGNLKEAESLSLAALFDKSKVLREVPIKSLYKEKFKTIFPALLGDELVAHYSLPAFMEHHAPEMVQAKEVKSNKLLIDQDVVLFSKLNPGIPKVWPIVGKSDYQRLGSTEWLPVIPTSEFSISYILAFLSSQTFLRRVMRYVQGTSNSHKRIDPKRFYELKIPLVSDDDRSAIVGCLLRFTKSKDDVSAKLKSALSLQKALINQVF